MRQELEDWTIEAFAAQDSDEPACVLARMLLQARREVQLKQDEIDSLAKRLS